MNPRDIVRTAEIPSIPTVLQQILSLVNNPMASSQELEKVVLKEPGLVTKLLRLVNSAYYALPQKISSVRHAMILVGFTAVRNIATGLGLINSFNSLPTGNKEYFMTVWKRSLTSAQFIKLFTRKEPLSVQDDLFLTAMIHEVGYLVLSVHLKAKYAEFVQNNLFPTVEQEREAFHLDHAELGSMLLEEWKFPKSVCDLVRHHHAPEKFEGNKVFVDYIDLSDALANHRHELSDYLNKDEIEIEPDIIERLTRIGWTWEQIRDKAPDLIRGVQEVNDIIG